MSAIRLRRERLGVEVRVDDEVPISDRPVTMDAIGETRELTVSEALELGNALIAAALEALRRTIAEPCDGRIPHEWGDRHRPGPRRAPR